MKNPENMKPIDHEISAKRKNSSNNGDPDFEQFQTSKIRNNFDEHIGVVGPVAVGEDDEDSLTTLSLHIGPPKSTESPPQLILPQQQLAQQRKFPEIENPIPIPTLIQLSGSHPLFSTDSPMLYAGTGMATATVTTPLPPPPPLQVPSAPQCRPPRARRNTTQTPREGKSETVPPPYPWATDRRATVHSMEYLLSKNIEIITGEVQCKRCEKQYEMGFNLREKFVEVGSFIAENKASMHDRAPDVWMCPVLPSCKYCEQENSAKPLISEKKKSINWLFLLLGQMLGSCTLEQLKYFCKHTNKHRTGAKNRVLYSTYLGLCKQLDPDGPFER